jgi:hypothetical protein
VEIVSRWSIAEGARLDLARRVVTEETDGRAVRADVGTRPFQGALRFKENIAASGFKRKL